VFNFANFDARNGSTFCCCCGSAKYDSIASCQKADCNMGVELFPTATDVSKDDNGDYYLHSVKIADGTYLSFKMRTSSEPPVYEDDEDDDDY